MDLFSGNIAQKLMVKQFAKKLHADNVKQLIITIDENGEMNVDTVNKTEDMKQTVLTVEYRYLLDFFKQKCNEQNKPITEIQNNLKSI